MRPVDCPFPPRVVVLTAGVPICDISNRSVSGIGAPGLFLILAPEATLTPEVEDDPPDANKMLLPAVDGFPLPVRPVKRVPLPTLSPFPLPPPRGP